MSPGHPGLSRPGNESRPTDCEGMDANRAQRSEWRERSLPPPRLRCALAKALPN